MKREHLDLRHVGGLFAVVVLLLGAVDLAVDGRIGVGDVVLNVVTAAAVTVVALFPTFRLPPRRRGEDMAAPAIVAAILAAGLLIAAVVF